MHLSSRSPRAPRSTRLGARTTIDSASRDRMGGAADRTPAIEECTTSLLRRGGPLDGRGASGRRTAASGRRTAASGRRTGALGRRTGASITPAEATDHRRTDQLLGIGRPADSRSPRAWGAGWAPGALGDLRKPSAISPPSRSSPSQKTRLSNTMLITRRRPHRRLVRSGSASGCWTRGKSGENAWRGPRRLPALDPTMTSAVSSALSKIVFCARRGGCFWNIFSVRMRRRGIGETTIPIRRVLRGKKWPRDSCRCRQRRLVAER